MLNANTLVIQETTTIGFLKFVIHHLLKSHTLPQLVGTEDSRSGTLNSVLSTHSKLTIQTSMLLVFHHSVTTLLPVEKTIPLRSGTSMTQKHPIANMKLVQPLIPLLSIQKCNGLLLVLKTVLRFGIFTVKLILQLLALLVNHSQKLKEPKNPKFQLVLLLLGTLLVTSSMLVSMMASLEFITSSQKMLRQVHDFV